MKFLSSQVLFFFQNKTAQKNLTLLAKFFGFLLGIVIVYSIFFHLIMLYEGRDFSWITGVYWTLTVMSTLGFGDITFQTDLGRSFTLIVLVSGVMFLLIMLPFSFIQFFYAPWLEAQTKSRTPRELPEGTKDHVIITELDPIAQKIVEKLKLRGHDYVIIVPDLIRGVELHDMGYKVVVGEVDDPDTYFRVHLTDAALVVITNDDMMATNIAFTVRGITTRVPIVAGADKEHSLDILNFPGNVHVFLFMQMLGRALAERVVGVGRKTKIVSSFDELHIAEIPVKETTLSGQFLMESQIRQQTGLTVVGLWDKGRFEAPHPKTVIDKVSALLLAGTIEQLDLFEELYALEDKEDKGDDFVLILGGGRVGFAAAETLEEYGANFLIVEKQPTVTAKKESWFVQGDAADREVLQQAGIQRAKTAIITTHNDAMNIYLTFYCRKLRPDIQIISRGTTERSVNKLHMAGADLVMSYATMGASSIMKVFKPDEVSVVTEGMNLFSHSIPKSLAGKTLVESNIRQETGCSVVALRLGEKLLVGPDPTVPLSSRAELILIGNAEAEVLFDEIFCETA